MQTVTMTARVRVASNPRFTKRIPLDLLAGILVRLSATESVRQEARADLSFFIGRFVLQSLRTVYEQSARSLDASKRALAHQLAASADMFCDATIGELHDVRHGVCVACGLTVASTALPPQETAAEAAVEAALESALLGQPPLPRVESHASATSASSADFCPASMGSSHTFVRGACTGCGCSKPDGLADSESAPAPSSARSTSSHGTTATTFDSVCPATTGVVGGCVELLDQPLILCAGLHHVIVRGHCVECGASVEALEALEAAAAHVRRASSMNPALAAATTAARQPSLQQQDFAFSLGTGSGSGPVRVEALVEPDDDLCEATIGLRCWLALPPFRAS